MKKSLLILGVLFSGHCFAEAPEGYSEAVLGMLNPAPGVYSPELEITMNYSCNSIEPKQVFINWDDSHSELTVIPSGELVKYNYNEESLDRTISLYVPNECTVQTIEQVGPWDFKIAELNNFTLTDSITLGDLNTVSGMFESIPRITDSLFIGGQSRLFGSVSDLPQQLTNVLSITSPYVDISEGQVSDIPRGVVELEIESPNSITGNLNQLPSGIYDVYIGDNNQIVGDISEISNFENILRFSIADFSSTAIITGDISTLPEQLILFWVSGANEITGDIASLSNDMEIIRVAGNNTIYGDIQNAPESITNFSIQGENTISGNIEGALPNVTADYAITGNNTLTGDISGLPRNVGILIDISGQNSVSGDLSSLPGCVGLGISIGGQNTVTGNINDLPHPEDCSGATTKNIANYFSITGLNTIYGELDNIFQFVTFLELGGNSDITLTEYDPITNETLNNAVHIDLKSRVIPTANTLDNIIEALVLANNQNGELIINMEGYPTPTNIDGITTLESRGWTVSYN